MWVCVVIALLVLLSNNVCVAGSCVVISRGMVVLCTAGWDRQAGDFWMQGERGRVACTEKMWLVPFDAFLVLFPPPLCSDHHPPQLLLVGEENEGELKKARTLSLSQRQGLQPKVSEESVCRTAAASSHTYIHRQHVKATYLV